MSRIHALLAVILFAWPLAAGAQAAPQPPTKITAVLRYPDQTPADANGVHLGGELMACIDGTTPLDAAKWSLQFNGHTITDATQVRPGRTPGQDQCMIFTLARNATNKDAWAALLGRPAGEGQRHVQVSLAHANAPNVAPDLLYFPGTAALILGGFGGPGFALLAAAITAIVLGYVLNLGGRAVLRDRLLPQLKAEEQPYSLGRLQMAFWFVLIACAFVFLWVYDGDFNTLNASVLGLAGISGTTALLSVAANDNNDDDLTKALQDLKDVGWNTLNDVTKFPAGNPPGVAAAALATANTALADYRTQNLWKDLFHADNGVALHRIQVAFWTLALGAVFIVGVWQTLAMPVFDATLLGLMGISGATYVGFKAKERS